MNWLDMLIILFILLGAVGGYQKGLIASFSKLASYILGFIGAITFYKQFASFLKTDLGFDSVVMEMVSSLINMPVSVSQVPIQNLSLGKLQTTVDALGMPMMYKTQLQELLQQLGTITNQAEVSTVGEALYYLISWAALEFIAFMLLVFIIEVSTSVIIKLVVKAVDFTPAAFLDKWAGLAFGSAKSFIVMAIMLIAITPVITLGTLNKEGTLGALSRGVQGSQISAYVVGLLK